MKCLILRLRRTEKQTGEVNCLDVKKVKARKVSIPIGGFKCKETEKDYDRDR